MAFTHITVTRNYDLPDGADPAGYVLFQPVSPMVNDGVTVVATSQRADLDVDGLISIVLAANNDPGTLPVTAAYLVTERVVGQASRSYYVVIPYDAAAATIDLGELDILDAEPPTAQALAQHIADTSPHTGLPSTEDVRDLIGSTLVAGSNVTITVDDPGNTVTIAATGGGGGSYTDEEARDAIGTALVGGTGITVTPSDPGDTITVAVSDAELTALAGTTSAADKVPYFTGSGTATTADLTSTARSLLDDTSTSAMRTTLGLAIGTNVQAQDTELSALAGTTSAADTVPYYTGSGTASTTDLTSTARSLLDDTSTSAMRTTLGLAINTDVQAHDADLDTIAGLTATTDNIIQSVGSAWASRTPAQVKTALSLNNVDNTSDASKPVSTATQTALDAKQPLDTELTALASTTSAADKVPYYTGSGTASTTDLTSTARTLLDDTTTSAMRTTLGVAIGTDVQAQDPELSALASTTSAADKVPYYTGAGTATTTDLTSFARTLLDDTTQAAARTTLGLTPGTDVQTQDSDLTTIAGLTATTDNFLQSKSSAWASRTPTQVAADLVTPLSSSLQPLDSDLTTIAGLTATTDNFLQSKSSAWASRTPTQVAADLVTPLSSSLQPLDTELTALAGLTSAADAMPYFTGSGTASTATVTSYARTVLDDTTAIAARATLGVTGTNSAGAHGVSAWSYDPIGAVNSSLLTNGTVYLVKIVNPPADTVTKIYWLVATVGSAPVSNQNFVGLYDSTGQRLATTGVDADVTASAGLRTTTISGQLLSTSAFYWVGFVFNASTAPTLARAVSGAVAVAAGHVGLTAATYRFATSSTSQTLLPTSITPSSNAAASFQLWAAVGT